MLSIALYRMNLHFLRHLNQSEVIYFDANAFLYIVCEWIMNRIHIYVCTQLENELMQKYLFCISSSNWKKIFFIWCRFKFRHTSAPYYFYRNDSFFFSLFSSSPVLRYVVQSQIDCKRSMTNIRRWWFLSLLCFSMSTKTFCDFYSLQIHDRKATEKIFKM